MTRQPIETAPKDGTRVLLFLPDYREGYQTQIGHYSVSEHLSNGKLTYRSEQWWCDGGVMGNAPEPSHWMPLPDMSK